MILPVTGVPTNNEPEEFDTAFAGFPVTADYRDFVLRVGGGIVGAYEIYGLKLAKYMGAVGGKSTAPAITKIFREKEWPGVDAWLIFTFDNGNPVGLAGDGSVWISDIQFHQIQKLADDFEGFILKWALKVEDRK